MQALGARGVRKRVCVGARARAQAWALAGACGRAGSWAEGALAIGRSRRGRTGRWAWARGGLGVGPRGARPGGWARSLGWPGLCTWCTQPFLARFDSVFS